MRNRLVSAFGALLLVSTMFALQACFEHHHDYGYGPPPAGVEGDYDEHHEWHERKWWVENRRDWVAEHHHEWLEEHEEHDHY